MQTRVSGLLYIPIHILRSRYKNARKTPSLLRIEGLIVAWLVDDLSKQNGSLFLLFSQKLFFKDEQNNFVLLL